MKTRIYSRLLVLTLLLCGGLALASIIYSGVKHSPTASQPVATPDKKQTVVPANTLAAAKQLVANSITASIADAASAKNPTVVNGTSKTASNNNVNVANVLNAEKPVVSPNAGNQNTRQAAATKACQMAANPDECLRKLTNPAGTPINLDLSQYPLTSDLLGLSGPLSFVLRYDQDLALILGVDYVHLFSETFGVNTKLALGKKERRANITAGFALTPDQQVKLTYEYLAQNQNFDFASGTVQQWVDQHAIGGAYQYLLRHEILHSFEVSGYTIRANSKDLSSLAFNQTSNQGGYNYNVNDRRIEGGTENTVQAALNLLPLKNTALTVGAGYSEISYDTQYETSPSNSGLAYEIKVEHVLTSKTKLAGGVKATASGREHTVGISHILPKNVEVSLKGQYVAGTAGLPDSNNVALGFTYPAPKSYSLGGFASGAQELHNWIEKPVVYATRVLAIKDERVQSYNVSAANWDDQVVYPNDANSALRQITTVSTVGNFVFNDPDLTVTFTNTLICPSTHTGSCTLDQLNLKFDTSISNQAILSSTGDFLQPATAPNAPYVITVIGTAARPGLNPPAVTKAVLNVNVVSDFVPPATAAPIRFDLINDLSDPGLQPQASVEIGAGASQPLINLSLMPVNGREANATFSTTQANWQVANCGVIDAVNNVESTDKCLFRELKKSNGHLEAGDISNTAVQVPVSVTMNGITQTANIPVIVTGDNINTIHGEVPTAYSATSSQTITDWNTAPAGQIVSSYYGASNNALIAIDNDTFGPWQAGTVAINPNGGAPSWTAAGGILNINNAGLMTGTAPTIDTASSYVGMFNAASKAAATQNIEINFSAQIQPNFIPPTIAAPIRFDLINDARYPGLQPQANVETGSNATQPLINLSLMAAGGRSTNASFSTTQANWHVANCGVTDAANDVQSTDKCLFRALNSNNKLEASDISNTAVQVPVNVTINGATQVVNIPVIVTGDSKNDIHGSIAMAYTSESAAAINWNAANATVAAGYYGATPSSNLILAIDGDVYNGWVAANSIVPQPEPGTPAWVAPASLSIDGSGFMTGTAPTVSGANNYFYNGTFNAQSKAATTRANGVSVVFPSMIIANQWIDTSGKIKFDNIAIDPNDSINLNSKINPTMTAITLFTLGTSANAAGNYNPANWQIVSDASGAAYYLVRKANGSNIDAEEVGKEVQVPVSVTGTVSGSVATSNTVLNVTVNPDEKVFYQYQGDGSTNSPASPVTVAAQYPTSTATNVTLVLGGNNVKPKLNIPADAVVATYDVINDSALEYSFPAPQRSYISYPDTKTVQFNYAPSTDLGDAFSLVEPSDSSSIRVNSKAHGSASWGAMQGLNVRVKDLSVTTLAPSAGNANTQCSDINGISSTQRSIYYVTVPLSSGRNYDLKGISTTAPANNSDVTRTICPGNPGAGTAYSKGNIDAPDSKYDCSGTDGTTYTENATKTLPAVRSSGAGANELTFFVTQRGLGCDVNGGGSYPRINSPIMLSISSNP